LLVVIDENQQAGEGLGLDRLFNGEANENFLDDPLDEFWMHDGNPFETDHGLGSPSDSSNSSLSTGGASTDVPIPQASKRNINNLAPLPLDITPYAIRRV
jgi:hypothetical protein